MKQHSYRCAAVILVILSILALSVIAFADSNNNSKFKGSITATVQKNGNTCPGTVVLTPTNALVDPAILQVVSRGKESVTWQDIATYEKTLAYKDAWAASYIDNFWTARINAVLSLLQKQCGVCTSLQEVLSALGIPMNRPTGGIYALEGGCAVPGPRTDLNNTLDPYTNASNTISEMASEKETDKQASRSR